jgi:mycothiol synthase
MTTSSILDHQQARQGLVIRALDLPSDWARMAELIRRCHLADGVDWIPTAETLEHEWSQVPNFSLADDLRIAELDGQVVGLVNEDWRVREGAKGPKVVHQLELWVDPAHRRRGIATRLLEWAEARASDVARSGAGGPTGLPHEIGGWGDSPVPGHGELAARHGYQVVRYGFEMLRPVADPVPDAPLPPGIEVRPVEPSHHRAIWDADIEAFLDHWEPGERTEADFERWFKTPWIDTSLYQVAWAGDEVVGAVMPSINPEENEALGVSRAWLDHISVRRPWRRKGVAASLIASALRLLAERGIAEAALGVDGENPNGAVQLYEKLGFRVHRQGVSYRKALRV